MWRAADYRGGVAMAQMHLARLEASSGEYAAALTRMARARATLVEIGADSDIVEVDMRTAEVQLAAGEPESARRLVDETIRRNHALGGAIDQAPLWRVRAEALLGLDDIEGARDAIDASLRDARDRGASFEVARALAVLARLEQHEGNDRAAVAYRIEAAERFDRLGVINPNSHR